MRNSIDSRRVQNNDLAEVERVLVNCLRRIEAGGQRRLVNFVILERDPDGKISKVRLIWDDNQ